MKSISKLGQSIQPSLTLALTAKAKKMKSQGEDVISFTAGEPDFNTPENICNAGIEAINKGLTKYTVASGMDELKEAIVNKLSSENNLEYTKSQIIVSNGAKHSLFNVLFALCNEGDDVILPSPYWVTYPELIKLVGANPIIIETSESNGFKVTIDQLNKIDPTKVKAIIINNPNNPTGAVYSKKELEDIGNWCVKHDIYIIADEIYEKLVYDGINFVSMANINDDIKDRTIIINGMSKTFSMTGWRIGYIASNNDAVIRVISGLQSHMTSNPCSISQYASVVALEDSDEFILSMKTTFEKRRNLMLSLVNDIKEVSCEKPEGAFYIMLNIQNVIGKTIAGKVINNSIDFADVLLDEAKVSVVPGVGFGAEGFVRLSYSISEKDIEEGIKRIKDLLSTMR
ncbi:MAG: pyridoxal phosphate-dependent aminotransferase [Tissierellia bacterium]|nr:pyridoxal phosphate-dependent aminotransferase [Tissierellia bacterium]